MDTTSLSPQLQTCLENLPLDEFTKLLELLQTGLSDLEKIYTKGQNELQTLVEEVETKAKVLDLEIDQIMVDSENK